MPDIEVLDSVIHYEEAGEGDPIVLLHGNPTSSYLWRNVIPGLQGEGRCLAPDLIGFGRSGKPKIDYRFVDHARYLDAWFDALGLDRVTIIGHDWGGALGFHWAARHPEQVAAVAFFETIIKPLTWEEWPPAAVDIFRGFRTPETGEQLILDRNLFIEAVLPGSVERNLSEEEMEAYRAPFTDRDARWPMLQWPRELPIEGEPADVVAIVQAYGDWLRSSRGVPKLLLTFEPGAIIGQSVVEWCRSNLASFEIHACGRGIHFVQEDEGPAIADTIRSWRRRVLP